MKFLLAAALVMAVSYTTDTCPTTYPTLPRPQLPSCPANLDPHRLDGKCYCGENVRFDPTCPTGTQVSYSSWTCVQSRIQRSGTEYQSCSSIIQDLTFKNSIGCITCASGFCLPNKTSSLDQAIQDESECSRILACLQVHRRQCGCSA